MAGRLSQKLMFYIPVGFLQKEPMEKFSDAKR